MTRWLLVLNLMIAVAGWTAYACKKTNAPLPPVEFSGSSKLPEKTEPPPVQNRISLATPSYLNYDQTVQQLRKWQGEAPGMTEVTTYGKTSRQKDIYYLRIFNKKLPQQPRVLITACIHGNEPLSAGVVMAYTGNLLDQYGKDTEVTQLLDSRDIYVVPVVSPDSYPNSRHVDGVDPNRNFPTSRDPQRQSVPPVMAIRSLFLKIKPNAVISAHTWGRVFLTPWGDQMADCPNHADYQRVVGKCAELCNYRMIRACDMYKGDGGLNNPPIRLAEHGISVPIHGSEVDWYYRNGALSVVMEMGTHQAVPSDNDIKSEFNRTWKGFLHFVREAPLVQVRPSD